MVPLWLTITIAVVTAGGGFAGGAALMAPKARVAEAAAESAEAAADAARASAEATQAALEPFVLEGQARLELSDLTLAQEALGFAFVVGEEGEAAQINWIALDAAREFHCRAQTNASTGGTSQTDCKPLTDTLVTKSILHECQSWAIWLSGGQADVAGSYDVRSQAFQRALADCIAEFGKKH